jgi:hypothetical protein
MVAYRGPREGHDAWQGDAFHFKMMEKVAEHIGHPVEQAHLMAEMPREILRERAKASGPLPVAALHEARKHQAHVNRAHPHYEKVANRRKKLVEHSEAQYHFKRIQELLNEHNVHGTSQERQLAIHAELSEIQDKLAHLEEHIDKANA